MAGAFVAYDLLFSKPDLQEGIILEKVFVPGTPSFGGTPYGGTKRQFFRDGSQG